MDVLARFRRSPHEEIRLLLNARQGQPYLEIRVSHLARPGDGTVSWESLGLPVALVPDFAQALQSASAQLGQRGLLARGEPAAPEPGPPAPPLAAGRQGGVQPLGRPMGQAGRATLRVPLACAVDYAVRSSPLGATGPARGRGRTVDLSRQGLQVVLPERIPAFSVLAVTLHLPMGALSAVCQVVWAQLPTPRDLSAAGCRHGLAFTELGPEDRRRLEALVDDLGG